MAALLFVVPSFLLVKYFWFCARQESFSLLVCVPWPNLGHESNEVAPCPVKLLAVKFLNLDLDLTLLVRLVIRVMQEVGLEIYYMYL